MKIATLLLAASALAPGLIASGDAHVFAATGSALPNPLRTVPIEIAPLPALVPIERTARNDTGSHPEVDRLIERLRSQSDDGTLNSQDYLRIRMLRKRLAS